MQRYGSDLLATAIPRRRSKFACLEKGDAMFGYGGWAENAKTGGVDLRFLLEYHEYVKAAGPPPHTEVSKWFCLRLLIADNLG
ncbi:hypothetical protein BCON_0007g00290 [Botryotinia convoluta]|uniref:Uncharacterized protein n=1 Tax=Botryotinia convoluta TaxID=54673 RepID=A0A4Z1ISA9_9HELO|nr:hypothetical protein BCON_0007g00290 [Botryotinia convoluta]